VKAAHRAWEAARELEGELEDDSDHTFELRVLVLGDGQDPADFVRTEGVAALEEAVGHATPVVPFLIRHAIAEGDLADERGRTETLRAALALLGDESDPELRRVYARTEVADPIGLSLEFVQKTAARMGIELDTHQGVAPTSGDA
jgi:DNA primase